MYENGLAQGPQSPIEYARMSAEMQKHAALGQQQAYAGARLADPGADNPSPRPAGPVFQAINGTEQELSQLYQCVEMLTHRLSTVLLPEPPSPAQTSGGVSPGRGPISEVTERVARIGLGIQSASVRLRGLIDRLEV
jgi:hypothetical protein